ncbi:MAG TPA: EAL domain-containing protein [Luteimonas sp.]|nr:EAL domain-containing protein [Luteimonas sp.]
MTRVLVVDDKDTNLRYMEALLSAQGWVVETARHGAEALELARRSPPDLVVSDLLMPVMDGYRLLRRWKLDPRLHAIPFIVYTATYTSAEDEQLALSLGADDFILKPAEPERLLARIGAVMARATAAVAPAMDGARAGDPGEAGDAGDLMMLYSRSLVRKLEQKTQQLEEGTRALEVERERLLAAQAVARVGSWQTDVATGDVIWSAEAHRIHGTDPATFAPTHARFLQRVHPDDRARVDAAYRRSQETAGFSTLEHRLRMDDGDIKHVEERWHVVFDDDGTPLRAIGTCQDISERKLAEAALRTVRDRLMLATRSARIGTWDWDIATDALIWDAEMYRLYGIADGQFGAAYEAWTSRIHPDDRARVQADIQAAVVGTRDFRSQFRIVWTDGSLRELDANGLVQRDAEGRALRMIGANRDITEQTAAERRIRHLNRVYALLSGVNSLIVRASSRDELYRDACRIAVDVGGFKLAMIGLLGDGTIDFVATAAREDAIVAAVDVVLAARGGIPSRMATRAIRDLRPCVSNRSQHDPMVEHPETHVRFGVQSMVILPLVLGDDPSGVLALYADEPDFFHDEEIQLLAELAGDVTLASSHIDNRERLVHLAYYDQLTGLANRSLFLERVAQYARSAGASSRLAVVMFDLERFRNLNESLGRPGGDALLQQIGAWLGAHVGDASLVARLGADHFAVVLPGQAGADDVTHLVEAMIKDFQKQSFTLDGAAYRLAARVGISLCPDDGRDAESLFKRAEAALKQAKEHGSRYLFYDRAMTESIAARLALESQLRDALDNREFVLHYQPKLDARTGALTGAEALIRWNDPRTGLVAPGLFIPVLEEIGLIGDVGQWALGQAVQDYLGWCQRGCAVVPIAVNVSPLQLRDPRFIDGIRQALSVDPRATGALELEITESVIMDDVDQGIVRLQAIRAMGIPVAIDDFGTGFSSLAYLAKLPIDTLKIDRTFINDMTDSPEKLSLVSTMITLAHSLKLRVVAEGVETDAQASALRGLACDEIQGYLISRPLSCADFEARFLGG